MAEITVAYARPDAGAADRVIAKLTALGFRVARRTSPAPAGPKRARPAGPEPAGRVLVLWSRHGGAELAKAAQAGPPALVARLDTAAPPPLLRPAAAIDLRQWRGRPDHRGWRRLVAALQREPRPVPEARVAAAAVSRPAMVSPEEEKRDAPTKGAAWGRVALWFAIGGAAAAAGAALLLVRAVPLA